MALISSYTYRGLTVSNAYFLIKNVNIIAVGSTMQFVVYVYANQAAAEDKNSELDVFTVPSVSYTVSGADPFTQGYSYLQSLPQFYGAMVVNESN